MSVIKGLLKAKWIAVAVALAAVAVGVALWWRSRSKAAADDEWHDAPVEDKDVVTVFKDADRNTTSRAFGVGDHATLDGWEDSISTMHIPAGFKVIAWQKHNFTGAKLELAASKKGIKMSKYAFPSGEFMGSNACGKNNSGCWNDTISSLQVMRA